MGFEEILDLGGTPGGREWTLVLLVFGISANLYVISSITSFFVEGDFNHIRRFRRVQRKMKHVENHYIVCGIGTTGRHVVDELLTIGESVIGIDTVEERLEEFAERPFIPLVGDATDDAILEHAGISRAKGVVATLDDDKTNMFVVVSARQHNPRARIVAKAVHGIGGGQTRTCGGRRGRVPQPHWRYADRIGNGAPGCASLPRRNASRPSRHPSHRRSHGRSTGPRGRENVW